MACSYVMSRLYAGSRHGVTLNKDKQKTPVLSHQGFFFVAECDEISNLRLVDDILKILEFIESKVS